MHKPAVTSSAIPAAALAALLLAVVGASPAAGRVPAGSAAPAFTAAVFATGAGITHPVAGGTAPVSGVDDITALRGDIFAAFQNGVGAQGQASSSGNLDSTIVAFNRTGGEVEQWDVAGKVDGMTADPATDELIATVNEDGNSSLYLIDPNLPTPVHFAYSAPLPSNGGTDAITVDRGMVLISASAPGVAGGNPAPQPTYPAVYRAAFGMLDHTVSLAPLFYDEAPAFRANFGSGGLLARTPLALTDPDSSELVPSWAARFAGDFMLTSQGDQQQIFVHNAGTRHQWLSVLDLPASVDDSAWPSGSTGTLYATDSADDTIYSVTGPFQRGAAVAAVTPCDSNQAPSTCPGPGYPANYLGLINDFTGTITPLTINGPAVEPKGLLFMP